MARKLLNGLDLVNGRIINLGSPSSSTDATNKAYVDGLVNGLQWKQSVRAASTANGTLASAYENGDTLDGVTLATGDRILLKNQSTGSENGIYVVAASGAPARATDADASAEVTNNMSVFVQEGTVNADTAWTVTNNGAIVLGTTALTFAQVGAGTSYTADGNGIELSGTQFALELDGTTLTKGSSGLRIGSGAAGAGLVESSGVLAVGAGTGITVNANDITIDTSVVVRKFAATIGDGSTTAITITHNLGTRDVVVSIHDAATYEEVYPDIVKATTNTVTATFATAPATNAYRAIVQG